MAGFDRSPWTLLKAFPPLPLAPHLRHTCLTSLQSAAKVHALSTWRCLPCTTPPACLILLQCEYLCCYDLHTGDFNLSSQSEATTIQAFCMTFQVT